MTTLTNLETAAKSIINAIINDETATVADRRTALQTLVCQIVDASAAMTDAGADDEQATTVVEKADCEADEVDDTTRRFLAYADDAGNWGETPLVGGNVGGDPADKGYLVNMKKRGWIETHADTDDPTANGDVCVWIYFTEAGRKVAAEHGIEVEAMA